MIWVFRLCNRKWKDWKNSGTSCFSLTLIHLVFDCHAVRMPARTLSVEKRTFIALECQKTQDVRRLSVAVAGGVKAIQEHPRIGYLYPQEIKRRVFVSC